MKLTKEILCENIFLLVDRKRRILIFKSCHSIKNGNSENTTLLALITSLPFLNNWNPACQGTTAFQTTSLK